MAEKIKLKASPDVYSFEAGFQDDPEIQTVALLLRPVIDNRAGNRRSVLQYGSVFGERIKQAVMPLDFNVVFDTTEAIGLILQDPYHEDHNTIESDSNRLSEGLEVVGFTKITTKTRTIDDSPFGAITLLRFARRGTTPTAETRVTAKFPCCEAQTQLL